MEREKYCVMFTGRMDACVMIKKNEEKRKACIRERGG